MDITGILTREELSQLENALCNARCELENAVDEMRYYEIDEETSEFNGYDYDEIQDIADSIAELEYYLFNYLQNENA